MASEAALPGTSLTAAELAAIIRRAADAGIPPWRVVAALGLPLRAATDD